MSLLINKGQKIDITKGMQIQELGIYLGWSTSPEVGLDGAAFLLNESGKCQRDEDFIFYNNPNSRESAVKHSDQSKIAKDCIRVSFSSIPQDIKKISITLTIDQGDIKGQHFSQVSNAFCRLINETDGTDIATFNFGSDLQKETAIVVGEIYLHNGEWKFNAIASGFNGGLSSLVSHFGLKVDEAEQGKPEPAAPPTPVPDPIKINIPSLTKVELKKKESINIRKSDKVTATLEWETKKDLDLYCFYVTKEGIEGKVYYKNLGSSSQMPFITLDGDAMAHGKETIVIHRPQELKYAMFCAYSAISNGTGSFKSMKVKAVVDNHNGQQVVSPLLEKNNYAYWVAIAHLDFTDNTEMKVSHIESYSGRGVERSPLLYKNGSFLMDVGPEEFK